MRRFLVCFALTAMLPGAGFAENFAAPFATGEAYSGLERARQPPLERGSYGTSHTYQGGQIPRMEGLERNNYRLGRSNTARYRTERSNAELYRLNRSNYRDYRRRGSSY